MSNSETTENLSRISLGSNTACQGLLITTLTLLAIGAVMVPSALATVSESGPWYSLASARHVVFAAVASLVVLFAWRINYQWFAARRSQPILAASLLVISLICGILVFVPSIGHSVGGYYRWIRIGPEKYSIGFQPSELIKYSLVIFLGAWLTRPGIDVRSFKKTFLPAIAILGVCLALVIKQDFGTAVLIAAAGCVTMLLAGVRWWQVASLCASGAGAGYLLLSSNPTRWARVEAMLHPYNADNPSTYQLRQSLTTITSGGWFGKGLGNGMMKRGFLPEDSTDFLFATICEEWGLFGAIVLIALFIVWFGFVVRIAMTTEDKFGRVLAGSIGILIALQAAMHFAVNLGCIPPTGISLPLVSAGGTSLMMTAAATALIASVSSRRTAQCELSPLE